MRLLGLLLLCVFPACAEGLGDQAAAVALAFAEGQAAGRPGQYAFKVVQPPVVPFVRPGHAVLEPTHLSKPEPKGRFFVAFRILVDGRPAGALRVDLEGRWAGTLLKARTSLARRQVLTGDLVEAVPMEGQPPAGALTELPEGMRVRLPVSAGKFLTQADLEPIPLIATGDKVRILAQSGPLTIHAEGIARSGGLMGDRIRLEMPSRRQITARISGPGEATLPFGK